MDKRREHFIDLQTDPDTLTKHVGAGFCQTGFLHIIHHPLSPDLLTNMYRAMQDVFSHPEQELIRYMSARGDGEVGFTPFGAEHAKYRRFEQGDLKRFWMVRRNQLNIFPDELSPDFGPTALTLFDTLSGLGKIVLRHLALSLGWKADHFEHLMRRQDNNALRLLHYPRVNGNTGERLRAAAHEDINLLTIIPAATTQGMELERRDGSWHLLEPRPEVITIIAGDMLQLLTDGYIRSTTHRVRNDPAERFAIGLYVHPHRQAELKPGFTAGQYLDHRLRHIGFLA